MKWYKILFCKVLFQCLLNEHDRHNYGAEILPASFESNLGKPIWKQIFSNNCCLFYRWFFAIISVSGVFSVTFSIVFAYVADITSEADRSSAYGLVSCIRLNKNNSMSQSCRMHLFCGVCLIQQNSSFWFFCSLNFFSIFFMNLLAKIYMKRYDRHNKHFGQQTSPTLDSVLYLVHPKIKFHISYWTKVVADSNLMLLLLGRKNTKRTKKNAFRVGSSNLSQALRHIDPYAQKS